MMPKEDARKELAKLIGEFQKEVESGSIDSYQETEIRTNFIDRFFQILGWDMHSHDEILREFSTHKQKRADYVFKLNNRKVFVVEAKRASVKLDNDEGEKAFKQAISYAYFNKIKFAVVTNFRQIFVFHALSNPKTPKSNLLFVKGISYFSFKFSEFLDKFDSLWLLSRESFLKNEMEKLLKEKDIKTSKPIDEAVLGDLVEIRKQLSSDIKTHNQDLLNKYKDETNLIEEAVQRLINRLIFIRYTEDRGLEDENLLSNKLKNYQDMTSDKRLYAEIRDIFLQFNGKYNSKLFSLHEIDKEIRISEKVMENVIRILYTGNDRKQENYNFAHIGVDLLGSIYEQYLGMLLHSTEKRAKLEDAKGKRKKMGIYYTPEYIVEYIVKSTIGEAAKGKSIDEILEMKILDPACGSGSFLIKAFDEVCSAVERGLKTGEKSKKFKSFQSFEGRLNLAQKITILKNTIHGVDLDEKAVEIAQLSLLLKLLENEESHANKMLLPTMTDNIQHGNSLIDDSSVAGDNAFKWESRFRDVFAGGGFDVVVGNPPYGAELPEKDREYLDKKFNLGNTDTACLFMSLAADLLKKDGVNGFIVPKPFVYSSTWKKIREKLLEGLTEIADCSKVWKEVKLEQVVYFFNKGKKEKTYRSCVRNNQEIKYVGNINKETFDEFGFLLNGISEKELKIGRKIKDAGISLNELVTNQRGGMYQKEVTEKRSDFKVLGGKQIGRYFIKEDIKGFISKEAIEDENAYVKQNSILIQNIVAHIENPKDHIEIISTLAKDIDSSNYIILDTVNQLQNKSNISSDALIVIINSKLMSWYVYRFIFGKAIRTMHFDNSVTERIPIPKSIDNPQQNKLAQLADRMLSLNKRLREPNVSSSERERIKKQIEDADFEIDEAVYRLYGITDEEKKVIEGSLK
ncbi:MAG: N-6 DNA methylase [Candidatus Aenigmatarchaeota archaeon]